MTLNEWIRVFRDLHVKARTAPLVEPELAQYHTARKELNRVLVSVVNAAAFSKLPSRHVLRVGLEAPVELRLGQASSSGKTWDVGLGGFGASFPADVFGANDKGKPVTFSLQLADQKYPASGTGTIVNVASKTGKSRVSVAYAEVTPMNLETIETAVWDAILATFLKEV
jgi:hypothetical protein